MGGISSNFFLVFPADVPDASDAGKLVGKKTLLKIRRSAVEEEEPQAGFILGCRLDRAERFFPFRKIAPSFIGDRIDLLLQHISRDFHPILDQPLAFSDFSSG